MNTYSLFPSNKYHPTKMHCDRCRFKFKEEYEQQMWATPARGGGLRITFQTDWYYCPGISSVVVYAKQEEQGFEMMQKKVTSRYLLKKYATTGIVPQDYISTWLNLGLKAAGINKKGGK